MIVGELRTMAVHELRDKARLGIAYAQAGTPVMVFQHGDPGVWNLLITPDGRPAFLDWEAAEHHGMPVWDLFYAARSVGIAGQFHVPIGEAMQSYGNLGGGGP